MKFQGSVIKEQGVTFAIVIVQRHIISNKSEADKIIASFQREIFGAMPIILMAHDHHGTPIYYGRPDIVKFLASVPIQAIPWKEYSIS